MSATLMQALSFSHRLKVNSPRVSFSDETIQIHVPFNLTYIYVCVPSNKINNLLSDAMRESRQEQPITRYRLPLAWPKPVICIKKALIPRWPSLVSIIEDARLFARPGRGRRAKWYMRFFYHICAEYCRRGGATRGVFISAEVSVGQPRKDNASIPFERTCAHIYIRRIYIYRTCIYISLRHKTISRAFLLRKYLRDSRYL